MLIAIVIVVAIVFAIMVIVMVEFVRDLAAPFVSRLILAASMAASQILAGKIKLKSHHIILAEFLYLDWKNFAMQR